MYAGLVEGATVAVSVLARLQAGQPDSDSLQGRIFFFATVSRWVMGPTQSSVPWVLGFVPCS